MRIQDISIALTIGLLLALPVEIIVSNSHRRQLKQYEREVQSLKEERQKMLLLQAQQEAERREAWVAGIESGRAARKASYSPTIDEIDKLSPAEFERAVLQLMVRDGLTGEVIGGRGDQAVDILAHSANGQPIAVQCKHTTIGAKVPSRVLYEVKGTSETVYGAKDSIIVTNGFFTRDALEWGTEYGIQLIDRDILIEWSKNGDHLYQLVELEIPI
ncbi:restriction endonuclease [Kitasatospora sp. NPDC001175]|uniref:restriction endonuclease n=1 Tax=Kitasatospora sp. NPDC001175 TaxID=3157103 RepID=UPI003CFC8543